MSEILQERYAENLAAMIRKETVSGIGNDDRTKFREFHALLISLGLVGISYKDWFSWSKKFQLANLLLTSLLLLFGLAVGLA